MSLATYPLLQEHRGGQKERILEKRKAAFHPRLGFVQANGLFISEVAGIEDIGGDDEPRAPLRRARELLLV